MESIENVIQSVQLVGMTQLNDTSSLLAFLKSRRSGSAKAMGAPGPNEQQLHDILSLAVRVPDHGKLTPWRFVLFEGDARAKIGQAFRKRWAELNPGHSEETLAFAAGLFTRAPVVVAVVSTAAEHPKIPVWEQQLSGAALCFNMVLAARAVGFDATWLTEWVSYDAVTVDAMGVKPVEKLMGLIYIGTASAPLEDRPRPDPVSLLTRWGN